MIGINTKKALIFDMDGTIVDNIAYHNCARLAFLKKHGIEIRPEEQESVFSLSTKKLIHKYIGSALLPQEIKELDDHKQRIYRKLYQKHIEEVEGFTKLLKEAKSQGLLIALATMGCYENIDMVLNTLDIKSYFDVIVSGDDVKKGKPNPDIYLRTLSLLRIKPEQAIVFEDTHSGVVAAQEAGIEVVGVCTSRTKRDFKNWGLTRCIRNFEEYSLQQRITSPSQKTTKFV